MTVSPGQLSLLPQCLNELDRAVLSFACAHHLQQGGVDARVGAELGVTVTRYYQLLAALLERPEAAEAAPDLVAGLRALRPAAPPLPRRGRQPYLATSGGPVVTGEAGTTGTGEDVAAAARPRPRPSAPTMARSAGGRCPGGRRRAGGSRG